MVQCSTAQNTSRDKDEYMAIHTVANSVVVDCVCIYVYCNKSPLSVCVV